MPDIPVAEFLRLGRKSQECVDLPVDEQGHRLGLEVADPTNVAERVQADEAGQHRQQHVRRGAESLHADGLAPQIADATDTALCDQLETADMDSRQQSDRCTGIHQLDIICRIIHREIYLSETDASPPAGPIGLST